MGAALTYLEEPIKDKELLDGCSPTGKFIRHGACEMQGWRVNMEDAQLAVPDLDDKLSLYGVFDGHGGKGVSAFAARELPRILKETDAFKAGDYKKALEDAFVQIDEQLRSDSGRKAVEELDRPDPSKPRRLLQVPRRMVERFQQRQNAQNGDDDDCDLDDAFDDGLGFLEGEEEEDFELDKEVELEPGEVPATEESKGSDAPAPAPAAADASASPAAEPGANSENVPPPAAEAPPSTDSKTEAASPAKDAEEPAKQKAEDGDDQSSEAAPDDDDDVLIDPTEITRSSNPEAQGCTAVVVLVVHSGSDGPQLICANAGDSRAMVSRRGDAIALSEDHKPEQPVETARIEKAGGFVKDMPGGARVMGDLNLSRAMGDLRYKQKPELPPAEQIVTVFPEVRTIRMLPEDEFLVLGCDGIWETNTNQDAVNFVRFKLLEHAGKEGSDAPKLSGICADICDRGLCPSMDASCDGKGCDNMTVMVVQLKPKLDDAKRPLPEEEKQEGEAASKRLKESEGGEKASSD